MQKIEKCGTGIERAREIQRQTETEAETETERQRERDRDRETEWERKERERIVERLQSDSFFKLNAEDWNLYF